MNTNNEVDLTPLQHVISVIEEDLDDAEDEDELQDDSKIFPTPEDRSRVMEILATLGATRIEVDFSGGGDSGEVEGVTLLDAIGNHLPMPDQSILGWERVDDEKANLDTKYQTMTISELLVQITYDTLAITKLDWYNNEGGSGTLYIDFRESPPRLQLEIGINYTESKDYEFTF